jgi:hypothetical protein
MKRRKTVSVTPAMGARTVAGEMVTVPIVRLDGTGFRDLGSVTLEVGSPRAEELAPQASAPQAPLPELSQNFFTVLFYLRAQNEAPAGARARFLD